MRKAVLLAILTYSGIFAIGQNICGTVTDIEFLDKVDVYKNMIYSGLVESRNETIYIPVTFHLVATNSGSNRLRIDKMLDQLDKANRDYAQLDVHFYLQNDDGLYNPINSDVVFSTPRSSAALFLMQGNRDLNSVNIFIVQTIPNTNNNIGNILGFYTSANDWFVQLKSETASFSNTFSHETGHFFGLPHPHVGWESDIWGDSQDELNTPAPTVNPAGIVTEFADSSNCGTAGDRICDTPADYNGLQYSSSCPDWNRSDILDPNSEPISPMTNNQMSYFPDGCGPFVFTPGQEDVMLANYASSSRNYLRPAITPQLGDIVDVQELISPGDDGTVLNGSVTLSWEEVPNTQFYLVNIAERLAFTTGFQEIVVTTNELTLDNLKDNDDYYWNVRPFNTYYSSPEVKSETRHFETGLVSAVNDIEGLNTFNLTPNPVNKNEFLSLRLNSQNSLTQARIEIRDITGRILLEQNIGHISSGPQVFNIETPELSSGYYLLSLNSEQGVKSERFLAL